MKACIHCHQLKPLEAYWRDKKQPDGHQNTCSMCKQDRYQSKKRSEKDEWVRRVSELLRGWQVVEALDE